MKVEPADLTKEEKEAKSEMIRITNILKNTSRRAEVGCCVRIVTGDLLESKCFERMKTPYIYGIITNLKDVCETTSSKAFQINWSNDHINVGNRFISFVAAQFEHDLEIVKFEDKEYVNEDNEFTRLFTKYKGK